MEKGIRERRTGTISRRSVLVAGMASGAVLALGAGVYAFLSRSPSMIPSSPAVVGEWSLSPYTSIRTVAWSPDGSAFAAGGSDVDHVTIWRTSEGQELTRLPLVRQAATSSVAWSPGGKYVAVAWAGPGSTGGYVSIWNASSWQHEGDFPVREASWASPLVIAWSPGSTRLAVGDSGGGLQIWNPFNGQALRVLQPSQANASIPVSSLAWSPDGIHLVTINTASAQYTVWNVATGKAMLLPTQHEITIRPEQWYLNTTALGWSPDGTTLVASEGGNVLIWQWTKERREWKELQAVSVTSSQVNAGFITALTWAPDSQRFATSDLNNQIRIWRASTGQQLRSYTLNPPQVGGEFQGYMDTDFEIYTIAWSPNGKHLLSGDYAGRVLLWNIL